MIAGLILAAGESSRMGRDKALLTYHGQPFLKTVVQTLRTAGLERVVVVLGHHADKIQRAVDLREVEVVINPNFQQGQTSSLQAGLRTLEEDKPEAVILCLVDHPAVSAEVVKQLIVNFCQTHAPVVIPTCHGEHGHPVLISRQLFPELLGLAPGTGGNTVIRNYLDKTQFIEVPDRGILLDVDEPETYERLR